MSVCHTNSHSLTAMKVTCWLSPFVCPFGCFFFFFSSGWLAGCGSFLWSHSLARRPINKSSLLPGGLQQKRSERKESQITATDFYGPTTITIAAATNPGPSIHPVRTMCAGCLRLKSQAPSCDISPRTSSSSSPPPPFLNIIMNTHVIWAQS